MILGHQSPDVVDAPARYVEVVVDEFGENDAWRCGNCGSVVVDRQAHDAFHDRLDR